MVWVIIQLLDSAYALDQAESSHFGRHAIHKKEKNISECIYEMHWSSYITDDIIVTHIRGITVEEYSSTYIYI